MVLAFQRHANGGHCARHRRSPCQARTLGEFDTEVDVGWQAVGDPMIITIADQLPAVIGAPRHKYDVVRGVQHTASEGLKGCREPWCRIDVALGNAGEFHAVCDSLSLPSEIAFPLVFTKIKHVCRRGSVAI